MQNYYNFCTFFVIIDNEESYIFLEEEIILGTYNLPRNVKGEGRILFIFSTKALIYTLIGLALGLPFYLVFKALNMIFIGLLVMAFLGLIGFIIATFKVPNSNAFQFTKSAGGENIDEVIKRYIKFKMAKNKIYVYKKTEIPEYEKEKEETKEDSYE